MGHGIELADERTVCAAITQEFIVKQIGVRPTQLTDMIL